MKRGMDIINVFLLAMLAVIALLNGLAAPIAGNSAPERLTHIMAATISSLTSPLAIIIMLVVALRWLRKSRKHVGGDTMTRAYQCIAKMLGNAFSWLRIFLGMVFAPERTLAKAKAKRDAVIAEATRRGVRIEIAQLRRTLEASKDSYEGAERETCMRAVDDWISPSGPLRQFRPQKLT